MRHRAKENKRAKFTVGMKSKYQILFPNMCDIHFHMLQNVFQFYGYNAERLSDTDQAVIETGLKYVHNDICYPALLTIGQMISALESGKYDVNHTALMMTQTGGGCRASNYIHLLRKGLDNAGFNQVPVISLSLSGIERNSGFKITPGMLFKALGAVVYGDMLMLLSNRTRPYEVCKGKTDELVEYWVKKLSYELNHKFIFSKQIAKKNLQKIVRSFNAIELDNNPRVKVGIVGEIYVKYSALANNNLEKRLSDEGCEIVVPGLISFLMYCMGNTETDTDLYGGSIFKLYFMRGVYKYFMSFESLIIDALANYPRFTPPTPHRKLKKLVEGVIGTGCKMGEGWLLTAEMLELCEIGCENIICVQPFGCLPNHIVGKGMIRPIIEKYPGANIVAIDYDASATSVNQENRIKLMLSIAREKLNECNNNNKLQYS